MGGSWTVRQGQSSSNKNFATIHKDILWWKHFLLTILNLWAKLFGRAAATYTVSGVHKQNPRRQKLIFPPIVLGVSQERDLFQVITISKETTLTSFFVKANWDSLTTCMVNRWSWSGPSGEVGSYWRTCPGDQLVTWVDDNQDLHVMGGG